MMKKFIGILAVLAVASNAWALTWAQPNRIRSDGQYKALAMYHFDDLSGDNAETTVNRDLVVDPSAVSLTSGSPNISGSSGAWDVSVSGGEAAAMDGNNLPLNAYANGLTVSVWMKGGYTTSATYPIVVTKDGWKNECFINYNSKWDRADVITRDVAYFNVNGLEPKLGDGTWHHYALTYDPTDNRGRLYVDNNLYDLDGFGTTSWDCTGGSLSSTATLLINGFTDGVIDELVIAEGAMTDFSNGGEFLPEPATLSLITLGGLALLRRKRRGN